MNNRLAFLLILLSFSQITAQNFKAAEGAITWTKVYESPLSQEQIRELMTNDAQLSAAAPNFRGRTEPVAMDCQGSTPIYMDGLLTYFVSIDFKDDRYRVSVSDLQLVPTYTVALYGVKSSEAPEPLEKFMLRTRDGQLRKNGLATRSLECMDAYLSGKFEFQELTESAEAW